MAPPALRHKGRLFPTLVISSIVAAGGAEAQTTARWYIGTYTNDVLVWDEASEQVIDRITMRNPIPTGITMSEAKDRLYVRDASSQVIEVVDVAAGEVIDEFTLSEDSVSVRINSFAPHPSNEKAIIQVMRYPKHVDRYTVEGPFVVEYSLDSKMVMDTVPLPDGHEAGSVSFRYSPDGETIYFFATETAGCAAAIHCCVATTKNDHAAANLGGVAKGNARKPIDTNMNMLCSFDPTGNI